MNRSTPGLPVHHQLQKPTQTHVYWVGDAIQSSHPLSSPSPPAVNHSQHQVAFSNESALRIKWPKYWSFSFNISPPNEHSGLISFLLIFIAIELLYDVVLLSSVQQSESAVCIHISPCFWISFPFRPPQSIEQIEFPVLYSRFSLVICFIHSSVYMSVPISKFIPPVLPPLGVHTLTHVILGYVNTERGSVLWVGLCESAEEYWFS